MTSVFDYFQWISNAVVLRKHRCFKQLREDSLSIHMDITNCCNLRCVMCCTRDLPMAASPKACFLPVDLFSKIAQQAFPFARTVRLACSFEPTLHPDFEQILDIAGSSEAMDVGFDTNGILLNESMSKRILLSGIDAMSISLDGWSSLVFESIRVGAKRDLVYGNLERFLALREELNPNFRLEMDFVLMRENAYELPDVARFAAQARCQCFNVIYAVSGIPGNSIYIGNDRELCDPLISEANDILTRSGALFFVYNPEIDHACCKEPWAKLVIDSSGRVYGCAQRVTSPFGDFTSLNFNEIWDGLPFLRLRSDLTHGILKDECTSCLAMCCPG